MNTADNNPLFHKPLVAPKPDLPHESESPKKHEFSMPKSKISKKTNPKEESLFGGKSVLKSDFQRYLKSPAEREEIASELGIADYNSPENAPKVDAAIKDILEKVKNFGVVIEPKEVQSLMSPAKVMEKYWEKRHKMEKELEDGIVTPQEIRERNRSEIKESIFKRLFGLNKKK